MLQGHSVVGLLVSAFVLVATTVASVLQPQVDPLDEPISNLALGHLGTLVDATFVIAGLGSLALAVAAHRVTKAPTRLTSTSLWVMGSICVALLGAFQTDRTIIPTTTEGRVHLLLAGSGFFLLASSFVMQSEILRAQPEWSKPLRFLRPLSWAGLALFCATSLVLLQAMLSDGSLFLTGLMERSLLAMLLTWTLVVSVTIRRLAAAPEGALDSIE